MEKHNWNITESKLDKSTVGLNETLFALGNGNIGVRGFFEEHNEGAKEAFLNSFYETSPIVYGEDHYGNPHTMETMVCLPNSLRFAITIDGETIHPFVDGISNYHYTLSFQKGVSERQYIYTSASGKKFRLTFERLVSYIHSSTIVQNLTIESLNAAASIAVSSFTHEKHADNLDGHDPRVSSASSNVFTTLSKKSKQHSCFIHTKTKNANHHLAIMSTSSISTANAAPSFTSNWKDETFESTASVTLKEGEKFTFTKYVTYACNPYFSEVELENQATKLHNAATSISFYDHTLLQEEQLTAFWNDSDVVIEGDITSQQAIRFNLFQMFGSVGKTPTQNIGAKGLTGKGYGGHYFWDTETYIFPFFAYTNPKIAQNLLEYRAGLLPKAKERAAELGFKGALFPWRTISGRECSAYYPAGTAQIHINADIMYAVGLYGKVTNDWEFVYKHSVPMLVEMSRFYADFGDYIPKKGFCINGVTGPDEYTTMINNNAYTNYMIRAGFRLLLTILDNMKKINHPLLAEYMETLSISEAEINEWKNIEQNIYIPKANNDDIIPQDDTFLEKKEWNFADTPKEKFPLLLHYHPMVIYKHQVLKQADLLLSFVWLSDEFSKEMKEANYKFYEKRTTHDSSLSYCIHSIVAYQIGSVEEGWNYLNKTFRLDLDNTHQNTEHGLHMACMGGSWLNLFYGVAGLHLNADGTVNFHPQLPKNWSKLQFRFTTFGTRKEVTITKAGFEIKEI